MMDLRALNPDFAEWAQRQAGSRARRKSEPRHRRAVNTIAIRNGLRPSDEKLAELLLKPP